MTIKILKLHPDAIIPTLGSEQAAGLDLYTIESVNIPPGKSAKLPTGIAMAIPGGMAGLIWPRSKLAAVYGIDVLAGVIDSDYRGELMISLLNTSSDTFELRKGDKVAQIIIQLVYSSLPIEVVDRLDETGRGDKGINSAEMRLS